MRATSVTCCSSAVSALCTAAAMASALGPPPPTAVVTNAALVLRSTYTLPLAGWSRSSCPRCCSCRGREPQAPAVHKVRLVEACAGAQVQRLPGVDWRVEHARGVIFPVAQAA